MRPKFCFTVVGSFVLGIAVTLSVAYAAEALGTKEAREKIAHLGGLANLQPNQVRIKSITAGAGGNAVVEAEIETAFKFSRSKTGWEVTDIRAGDSQWESVALMKAAFDKEKTLRTQQELSSLKIAIEAYRRERGRLVPARNIVELTDVLAPNFMPDVIRLDAWGRPLIYTTAGTGYQLSSAGPDGKAGTADDIVIEG
ncbi:MAG TPA: type II secretion system protein GspG [Blastocatellia bacterium]|nr:type II secretion system protein GspG [Blastocatellia bacterium]